MSIRDQLDLIRQQLANATEEAGRAINSVQLLAVSKTHPTDKILEAHACGQNAFGENYADELVTKSTELHSQTDIHWVFIGQLQSNKIQKIVQHADEIQSVASEKHARYIERYASEVGKRQYPIWIVVNAGDEDSKQGVSFADLPRLREFIESNCPSLSLQGIMAIPPASYSDQELLATGKRLIPDLYQRLRQAADETGLGKLSLGMTGDLRLAVAAGSDCVRIGTAIFGARLPKQGA